ncbi:DUF2225 domain-containing protein [Pontibacillus yanchengensis]|uniref:DUF2225 domain-containing protein n=2 Tax=Pontibacillus yanchengensis TaxID=462910 RepID=A0ACC7VKL9_9BACI|nr:DUF2225 domain-containing protein [Pontibacillus yanchengensis]MYL33755.1 DUF2225 domain-containing protein [Pontibacillus yanchengensis]MYL55347.1 DUF2225 domain-containing protein [Pontibacillus yanchengensis]
MHQPDPLYDKSIACPFYSFSYTTKKARSRFIRPIHTDTDFCTTYKHEAINPLYYTVAVCPQCGYSFTDQFSSLFPQSSTTNIQHKIVDQWSFQNYSLERTRTESINTFKLAIYTANLKKEKPIVLAGLYIRLAWLYRETENHLEEARFMRLAEQGYRKSYEEDDLTHTEMTTIRVLYMIGEINRRLGNAHEAIQFFSKVVDKRKAAFDPKIVDMARDQWYKTREDYKSETQPMQSG